MSARLGIAVAIFPLTAVQGFAQVFSSEFFSDPVSEGWDLSVQYCQPDVWNDEGWYHQVLDLDACPPGPGGAGDETTRVSRNPIFGPCLESFQIGPASPENGPLDLVRDFKEGPAADWLCACLSSWQRA